MQLVSAVVRRPGLRPRCKDGRAEEVEGLAAFLDFLETLKRPLADTPTNERREEDVKTHKRSRVSAGTDAVENAHKDKRARPRRGRAVLARALLHLVDVDGCTSHQELKLAP